MTSRRLPWIDIQIPNSDYNVRRVAGTVSIPLYWGKDAEGHCLFILELDGDHSGQFQKHHISVHGLKVDLRLLGTIQKQGLVISVENLVDTDIFLGLCETLVSSLKDVKDSTTGLSVVMAHLKRWKAFMAGKNKRLLSVEEVRGLFAELSFLQSLFPTHLSEKAAIESWCGAEGAHQDFIFANTSVEIKSLSGRERSAVRISSEDQLEGLCDNLYLMIYRLSEMPESDRAISLNDLARQIEWDLRDSDAIEAFSHKLAAYGYVEMRDYDEPKFLISSRQTFRVMDNFPRLIRSGLPDGVVRVGYEIELEKMAAFKCNTSLIWE